MSHDEQTEPTPAASSEERGQEGYRQQERAVEPDRPRERLDAAEAISPSEPQRPRSKSGRGLFWGLLGGCLGLFVLVTVLGAIAAVMGNDRGDWWQIGPKVAVVPIEGEIFDARETVERLREYADDRTVRAMVVRINSPGGAIVPSQEIFAEIRRLRRETGKPIIASLDSVAASGGYYIAVACDSIVANPGSITGSIGVITQWMSLEGLLEWAKLKPQTITSGSMKDAGSPYRDLTAADKAYIQRLVSQLHGQFVEAVTEGRSGKLTAEEVALLADGRVFTGEEAMELKLVDQLGTLQDAVELAASQSGIEGAPRTIYPRERQPGLLELMMDGESVRALIADVMGDRIAGTRFLYRWY